MAWEFRGKNGPYLYRSIRQNGRVTKQYLGNGEAADFLATCNALEATVLAGEREQARLADREAAQLEGILSPYFASVEAFSRAILEAIGYHRPKRGRWRKQRMGKPRGAALAKQGAEELDPRFAEQLATFRRAEDGDREALAAVVELADTSFPEVWDSYGNIAAQAREDTIKLMAGGNAVTVEALRRKVAKVKGDAGGPNPTPLEAMLATRVALCWLQCYWEDAKDTNALKQGTDWTNSLNQQKRAERAQRRYLAAVKALAQVRRLQIPAIQVNVGAQQVNVANLNGSEGLRSVPLTGG